MCLPVIFYVILIFCLKERAMNGFKTGVSRKDKISFLVRCDKASKINGRRLWESLL